MLERLTPYIWFLIAAALFMLTGSLLQTVLPAQGALIVAEVCCMLGFGIFLRRNWGSPGPLPFPSLARANVAWWGVLACLLAGALFGLTANVIGGLFTLIIPGLAEQALGYADRIEAMLFPPSLWLQALAIASICIFAPLCEEVLFRGTLLPVQREHEPAWVAIFFNGLLFSLLHMNMAGALSLLLLGMITAHLTLTSRSLLPAIACHAGVNTLNGVIIPRLARDVSKTLPELGDTLLMLAILLPASALTWWLLIQRLPWRQEDARA